MLPFAELIQAGIAAIMPAHILFPNVDNQPVGFSSVWLQSILRGKLKFNGVIFSDDLNMQGAGFAGDYPDRAKLAFHAGCDMILICNNQPAARQILDALPVTHFSELKWKTLQGKFSQPFLL